EYHVWFEQHSFERDASLEEGVEHSVENHSGDLLATLNRVRPVHEHFRLHDRHKILLLAEGGVSHQRMRISSDTGVTRQNIRDVNTRPPFREASIHAVILPQTIPETIEALGDGLIREAGKGLRASVDLNTGKDAMGSKKLCQRRTAGTLLTD